MSVFEIFKCDEWQPSVLIKINSSTVEGNKETVISEITLSGGDMYEVLNEIKKTRGYCEI